MIKTIKKYGNSFVLVFDSTLLELMGLKENSKVKLKLFDNKLEIIPLAGT